MRQLGNIDFEAARQQIPPDAVLVADKVEFNIFQIRTGQQSCFLLPQRLKVPLSKTALAVDISPPLSPSPLEGTLKK